MSYRIRNFPELVMQLERAGMPLHMATEAQKAMRSGDPSTLLSYVVVTPSGAFFHELKFSNEGGCCHYLGHHLYHFPGYDLTSSEPVHTLALHNDLVTAFMPGFQPADLQTVTDLQHSAVERLKMLSLYNREQYNKMASGFLAGHNVQGIAAADLHSYINRFCISSFFSTGSGVTMGQAIDLLSPPMCRSVLTTNHRGASKWCQVDYSKRSASGAFDLVFYPDHRVNMRTDLASLMPFVPHTFSVDMIETYLGRGEKVLWYMGNAEQPSFSMTVDAINARLLVLDVGRKVRSVADLIGALRNCASKSEVRIKRHSFSLMAARYQPAFNFIIPKPQDISQPSLQFRRRSR